MYYFTPRNDLKPVQNVSLCHPTYSQKYCITAIILKILDVWVNRRPWKTLKKGYIGTDGPETVVYTSNSDLFAVPIRKGNRTYRSGLECECFHGACLYIY